MATKDILAIRYSEALFNAASSDKLRDAVEQDFSEIKSVIEAFGKNKYLLLSKVVPQRIKETLWASILKANKFSKHTENFINLLVANNRLYCLPSVFDHFHNMLLDKKGILVANVTTATALNKSAIDKITKELTDVFAKPVKVVPTQKRDIIGGVIIRVGSRMIDCSISSKIQKLKQTMQSARI